VPAEILILDPEGGVRSWVPGQDLLRAASVGAVDPVSDLSFAGQGRWILIPRDQAPAGREKEDLEGVVIVVTLPSSAPGVPPRQIRFPGEGLLAAATPGGAAFVLARERVGKRQKEAAGQAWIHRLDLEAGRVAASTAIEDPGSALAIDPDGRRIYLAGEGRVRSFTTRPLATSWHYRSPGANRALAVRPGTHVLFVARDHEIALFDPDAPVDSGAGSPAERPDDATAAIRMSVDPAALRFSDDGRLLLVLGIDRQVGVIDVDRRVQIPAEVPAVVGTAGQVRPIAMLPGGPAVVAAFPAGIVLTIDLPPPAAAPVPSPPAAAPALAATAPAPAATVPAAPAMAMAAVANAPAPSAAETPVGQPAAPDGASLISGMLSGAIERVAAIVIYGPGSLIREAARATPRPDGRWEAGLVSPGSYRVLPVGPGAAPVGASPEFRTVAVEAAGAPGPAIAGVDFTIPAGR
jgi:hypothetical protein